MLYQYLKENESLIDILVSKGAISLDVINRFRMYDHYQQLYQGDRRKKTAALKSTAVKYKCSTKTVSRAVEFMES